MKVFLRSVQQGFPEEYRSASSTAPYWRYKDKLYIMDGVVMYDDRVVIPPSLRTAVLETLHSAHQGI